MSNKYQYKPNFINPKQVFIFRITHIDNLPFVLNNGLHCRYCEPQDPDFASIGSGDIISKRDKFEVPINPNGVLSDYVPFYFAPRSPMLYSVNINPSITTTQKEIIYLVTKASIIADNSLQYMFTDGHAIMGFTAYYDRLEDLEKVDWEVMRLKYWSDTPEDNDRKRRRMAEFLVHNYVPIDCIKMIGVYDETMKKKVEDLVLQAQKNIIVQVRKNWYY